MGNFKFIVKNKKTRRRWSCPKKVTLKIEGHDKATIQKTRKRTRQNKERIHKMTLVQKQQVLENNGILKHDTQAPPDLINTILTHLI